MPKLRIRELREDLGLGQCDLARVVGVSQTTVCQWESGNKTPMAAKLPALAQALNCTINDLFAADAAG